eukprot:m.51575 g.51575  ORF g.51575 m.51575 type:complete len:434 (+) comp11709_c1_seq1:742-2043(+)
MPHILPNTNTSTSKRDTLSHDELIAPLAPTHPHAVCLPRDGPAICVLSSSSSPAHSLSPPMNSPLNDLASALSGPGSSPGSVPTSSSSAAGGLSPGDVPCSDTFSPGSVPNSDAVAAGSLSPPDSHEGIVSNPLSPIDSLCIDELDANGNTPLMLACEAGRLDVVRALLARRASLAVRNVEGFCAIHIACRLKYAEIVDAILKTNSRESQNTLSNATTPLHIACAVSAPDVVGVLLRWGATVNCVDHLNTTPLTCAVRAHAVSCARLLLQASASTSMPDHNGWTALHWACSLGDRRLASLLIQYRCDIDVVNNKLCSPLMLAVREGNEDVVLLLLERFAKRNLEDQLGKTALDYAREYGHHNILHMLQDWTIGSRAKGVVHRTTLAPSTLQPPHASCEINSVDLSPPSSATSRSSLSSLGSLLASIRQPGDVA